MTETVTDDRRPSPSLSLDRIHKARDRQRVGIRAALDAAGPTSASSKPKACCTAPDDGFPLDQSRNPNGFWRPVPAERSARAGGQANRVPGQNLDGKAMELESTS